MNKKVDENIFMNGGSEEQEKRDKKLKTGTVISGVVLLLLALVLFLLKSDYVRNQLALMGSDAEYYAYVEQKNLEDLNQNVADWYKEKAENYEENGYLYEESEVQVSVRASAILKTWLSVLMKEKEAQGTLFYKQEADTKTWSGSLIYGESEYPVNYSETEEEFSLNSLLGADLLKSSKVKKLLEKYEKLIVEELAANAEITFQEKVLRSIEDNVAYQKALELYVSEEGLQKTGEAFFAELGGDESVRKIYESGTLSEKTYEEFLEETKSRFLEGITSFKMMLYVDNYGNITGRELTFSTEEGLCEAGYGYVANDLKVGVEVYAKMDGVTLLSISGSCQIEKEAVAEGTFAVSALVKEEMQSFQVSIQEVQILDLLKGRVMGTVWLTSDSFSDGSIELSLDATNEQQDILLSVWYGGAEQLFINISVLQ